MGLPKSQVSITAMDVLTHALEAYVSNMASDYTDGLAVFFFCARPAVPYPGVSGQSPDIREAKQANHLR